MGKKYVVSSFMYSTGLNEQVLTTMENYCTENDAELILMPLQGKHKDDDFIPERIRQYVGNKDIKFNSNVRAVNFNLLPQQIDPATGLGRFTHSEGTYIVPHTKQRLKVVPNSNTEHSKVFLTTGTVSKPNYKDNRIGNIAKRDHRYGGIVLDVEGNKYFHYRPLTFQVNGKMCDMGTKYDGLKSYYIRPEALVFGDLHMGSTNPKVNKANLQLIEELNPKRVVLHDMFDGYSINHHALGNSFALLKAEKKYGSSLQTELKFVAKELGKYLAATSDDTQVVIVKSNHDEVIDRWLRESRYIVEPQNTLIGHKLFLGMNEGKDPLQSGLELYMTIPDRVKFLSRDDDYKVRGVQLGAHGDLGANGARGSMRTKETAYGKSITGHTHTPEILRDTYVVGTSTELKLDYNRGLSSWMNTHGILHDTGKVQLINIIRGKYRT